MSARSPVSLIVFTVLLFSSFACSQRDIPGKGSAEWWLTEKDGSVLFRKQNGSLERTSPGDSLPVIEVDDSIRYQTIDGFGYTLTGGSAIHLMQMSNEGRHELLEELFAADGENIGVSYLRISIGASDLSDRVFSYDDLPEGETDPAMTSFSIEPERKELIPVLKEILAINPDIKIMGSPWSAPVWMKDNNDSKGGSLKREFFPAYARYFVKYVKAMEQEGIRIDAVTIQNEPLHPGNNPSMFMPAEDQAEFLKNHLGPAFEADDISTRIILYDHNADRTDYPISILDDPKAARYADGSAFHLYAGKISDLSLVHEAHPDKNLYFTEQWVGAPGNFPENFSWHIRELIIGATRNWCRTVLEWNLSSNPQLTPYTDRGGCSRCLGAVTIDGDSVSRNPAYYVIAHASKLVRPGSYRILSELAEGSADAAGARRLNHVAFRTPDGMIVLIVQNDSGKGQSFVISHRELNFRASLNAGAVATYRIRPLH